jgi:hypothetical protein
MKGSPNSELMLEVDPTGLQVVVSTRFRGVSFSTPKCRDPTPNSPLLGGIPSVVTESIELFALFSDAQATASLRVRDGRPGHANKRSASWIQPERHWRAASLLQAARA